MIKSRLDIIQHLINHFKYKSYLEIGVRSSGPTWNQIQCEVKDGVDPVGGAANYKMTSDTFFNSIDKDKKWDLIFVDGWHEKIQVLRDIENGFKHLNEGGTIVCHDINPPEAIFLRPSRCHNAWETFATLRATRSELEMFALPIDYVGVIRKGSQTLYEKPIEFTWDYLDTHRTELLNVITIEQFKEKYPL